LDEVVTAPTPGPLAEEAARLVEAIGDWARGAVSDFTAGAPTGADTTAATSTTAGGSASSRSPECQVCPVCQLLALVRRTQPDTFAHLADASASMLAALRTIVERHDHAGPQKSGVERIDLDGSERAGAAS
jgi:hypothetical protein